MVDESKKDKKTKLFILLGRCLLVILVIVFIRSLIPTKDSQGYSIQDKTYIINGCISNAQGRNTPQYINTYCNCFYNYTHDHLTSDELTKLNAGLKGDYTIETAPQVIKDATKACSK